MVLNFLLRKTSFYLNRRKIVDIFVYAYAARSMQFRHSALGYIYITKQYYNS